MREEVYCEQCNNLIAYATGSAPRPSMVCEDCYQQEEDEEN